MSELPAKVEEIETLREVASEKILRAYDSRLDDIVNEQVKLATEARNEAVRMKAGQKIIEHIVGAPTQKIESTSRSLKIVSHMPVPGIARIEDVIDTEVIQDKLPEAPRQLKAAASPGRRSKYIGKTETDSKRGKDLPMPHVQEPVLVEEVK